MRETGRCARQADARDRPGGIAAEAPTRRRGDGPGPWAWTGGRGWADEDGRTRTSGRDGLTSENSESEMAAQKGKDLLLKVDSDGAGGWIPRTDHPFLIDSIPGDVSTARRRIDSASSNVPMPPEATMSRAFLK